MKEKHTVYRAWIVFFWILIALGAFLFIYSVSTGFGANLFLFRRLTV